MKGVRKCGVCGEKGHNSRNPKCPGPKKEKEDEKKENDKKEKEFTGSEKEEEEEKKEKEPTSGKREQEEDEDIPFVVEQVLFGDLVLSTDKKGNYLVYNLEEVLEEAKKKQQTKKKKTNSSNSLGVRIGGGARGSPPVATPCEIFLDEKADEFAEARYGYFGGIIVYTDQDSCLVYVQAFDAHIPASYFWRD